MKQAFYGVQEELGLIEARMAPYLGAESCYNNYASVIEAAIGTLVNFESHHAMMFLLKTYGLPDDLAEDLAVEVRNRLHQLLYPTIGPFNELHIYHWQVTQCGDLEFMDLGLDHRAMAQRVEDYLEEVQERGDYIPQGYHPQLVIGA